MQFRTELNIEASGNKINYETPVFFMGSCFSENIGSILQKYKFPVLINPLGTIYDPLSVERTIEGIINRDTKPNPEHFIILDEVHYHLDFHSVISATDRQALEALIALKNSLTQRFLSKAAYVFITLGTAIGWVEKSSGRWISNCHKMPAEHFIRSEISVKEGFASLKNVVDKLKKFNSELKIIFTISPVRHTRSGIIENSRSKSRLIQMVDYIQKNDPDVGYFPAFEWMMDDLRDYRFYESDLVHPNNQAIEYLWSKFKECYFDADTQKMAERIMKVVRASEHRVSHAESPKYQELIARQLQEIMEIRQEKPDVDFSAEEEFFKSHFKI